MNTESARITSRRLPLAVFEHDGSGAGARSCAAFACVGVGSQLATQNTKWTTRQGVPGSGYRWRGLRRNGSRRLEITCRSVVAVLRFWPIGERVGF
jgi:hypothetical protein